MTKLLDHIRRHVVGYVALFVALGGTGYAAFRLPNNSVGTAQIRNHAVTPAKLDPGAIAASVWAWATVDAGGRLVGSKPTAKVVSWGSGFGVLSWRRKIPRGCFALASVGGISSPNGLQLGYATAFPTGSQVNVNTFDSGGTLTARRVSVAVLCPPS
jgi:hypothetical protein